MRGHRGADVERLQGALNVWLGRTDRPDGIFGPQTEARVQEFQRTFDLIDDGKAGPFTQSAILETSYRFALTRPPAILQSQYTCWAAAFAATTQASWEAIGVPRQSVEGLLATYDSFLSGNQEDGTWGQMSFAGLNQLCTDLRLFARPVTPADMRIERFSRALWQARVSIILVDNMLAGDVRHARVVYGVHVRRGVFYLMMMDPLRGYVEQDFGTLLGSGEVMVVVPSLMRGP